MAAPFFRFGKQERVIPGGRWILSGDKLMVKKDHNEQNQDGP